MGAISVISHRWFFSFNTSIDLVLYLWNSGINGFKVTQTQSRKPKSNHKYIYSKRCILQISYRWYVYQWYLNWLSSVCEVSSSTFKGNGMSSAWTVLNSWWTRLATCMAVIRYTGTPSLPFRAMQRLEVEFINK